MIMFWNRREVYIGFSMKKFSEVRDILSDNNIKYDYKIVNHMTSTAFDSSRTRYGSSGMNSEFQNEYYIYVHKNDYEFAYAKINGYC